MPFFGLAFGDSVEASVDVTFRRITGFNQWLSCLVACLSSSVCVGVVILRSIRLINLSCHHNFFPKNLATPENYSFFCNRIINRQHRSSGTLFAGSNAHEQRAK
jgi:hypothetical protein